MVSKDDTRMILRAREVISLESEAVLKTAPQIDEQLCGLSKPFFTVPDMFW